MKAAQIAEKVLNQGTDVLIVTSILNRPFQGGS